MEPSEGALLSNIRKELRNMDPTRKSKGPTSFAEVDVVDSFGQFHALVLVTDNELAAHYLKEKRSSLDSAVSMSESEIYCSAESVAPSSYLGQFAQLIEQGDAFVMQTLTDEEYMCYAIFEGKRFQDSFEIIALLKKSCESYNSLKVRRMASFCGFQMAREYYAADDFNNAKLLFNDITSCTNTSKVTLIVRWFYCY